MSPYFNFNSIVQMKLDLSSPRADNIKFETNLRQNVAHRSASVPVPKARLSKRQYVQQMYYYFGNFAGHRFLLQCVHIHFFSCIKSKIYPDKLVKL